ncbi:MAG: hypothetical protein EBX50_12840 [Chitinophagia bacterium]|nr:hypothetical protein [Chitinophagia bacterium]
MGSFEHVDELHNFQTDISSADHIVKNLVKRREDRYKKGLEKVLLRSKNTCRSIQNCFNRVQAKYMKK